MNRLLLMACIAVASLFAVTDTAEARHRRKCCNESCCKVVIQCSCDCCNCNCCCCEKSSDGTYVRKFAGAKQSSKKDFWPFDNWDNGDEVGPYEPEPLFPPDVQPEPQPEPTPVEPETPVDPQPEPLPTPEPVPAPDNPTPQPDPEPLPPEPPAPDATPDAPALPSDKAELNAYVAKNLGGYNRANFEKNGITFDIYQARGKQRVVWVVDDATNWQTAFVRAFTAKSKAGSAKAGIALVCHCPKPDEPLPVEVKSSKPKAKLFKFGGDELVDAEAACRAAGLWLVVVHDADGTVNRVLYGGAN